VLAIRVDKNDTPGSCKQKTYESPGVNGGALGADNPTFHASIGWDWIPTVRGRNTGIWGDVFLESTGAVTLANPAVTSALSDNNQIAQLTLAVEATNHTAKPIQGASATSPSLNPSRSPHPPAKPSSTHRSSSRTRSSGGPQATANPTSTTPNSPSSSTPKHPTKNPSKPASAR
jgi:hypothetical protein